MAKFTLQFRCDNAAFDDGNRRAEVVRILRETAERVEAGEGKFFETIRDINGNEVGQFKLIEQGDR